MLGGRQESTLHTHEAQCHARCQLTTGMGKSPEPIFQYGCLAVRQHGAELASEELAKSTNEGTAWYRL